MAVVTLPAVSKFLRVDHGKVVLAVDPRIMGCGTVLARDDAARPASMARVNPLVVGRLSHHWEFQLDAGILGRDGIKANWTREFCTHKGNVTFSCT